MEKFSDWRFKWWFEDAEASRFMTAKSWKGEEGLCAEFRKQLPAR